MVIFGSEVESRPEWTRMVAVVYGSEGGELGFPSVCGIYKSAPRWRKSAYDGSKTSCALPHWSRGARGLVPAGFNGIK